jgi:hypothetical protein
LNAGAITVPCLIAIRSALATTNTPIESRMGKKQGVMVLTSKYIETFDPRPDRSAVQVLCPRFLAKVSVAAQGAPDITTNTLLSRGME